MSAPPKPVTPQGNGAAARPTPQQQPTPAGAAAAAGKPALTPGGPAGAQPGAQPPAAANGAKTPGAGAGGAGAAARANGGVMPPAGAKAPMQSGPQQQQQAMMQQGLVPSGMQQTGGRPAMTPSSAAQQQQFMNAGGPYGSMGPSQGMTDGFYSGYGSMAPGQMGANMQGGMPDGNMQGDSLYGNSMYGAGSMMGNNMYGSMGAPMMTGGSMYGANPMMGGSMYGGGNAMPGGSMYSMGGMGSAHGSAYMGGRFTGSIYGGSFFGQTGSLYGQGGSLYGKNDMNSVMGSMYGMGSMYECGQPHTSLGQVKKSSDLKYSITFGSQQLSSTPSHRESFYDDADLEDRKPTAASNRSIPNDEDAAGKPKVNFMTRRAKAMEKSEPHGNQATTTTDADKAKEPAPNGDGRVNRAVPPTVRIVPVDEDAEAPRSPTTEATTLPMDLTVQTVAVVEKAASGAALVRVAEGNKILVEANGKKSVIAFSEAVSYDPKDTEKDVPSAKIEAALKHFRVGHNAGLMIAADKKAGATVAAVLRTVMKQFVDGVDKASASGKTKPFMDLSLCAVNKNGEAKDLVKSGGTYGPLKVGASPIFGNVVIGLETVAGKTASEFADKLVPARELCAKEEATLLATMVFKQIVPGADAAAKPDVFLSSLVIAVAPEGDAATFSSSQDNALRDVLRTHLGAACVTVAILCLSESSQDADQLAKELVKLGEVKNSPPRSGNVERFIKHISHVRELTKEKVSKSQGPEKESFEKSVARLTSVLNDYQEVLDHPETTKPKVYRPIRVETPAEEEEEKHKKRAMPAAAAGQAASPSERRRGAKSAANTADNPKNKILTVVLADGTESPVYKVDPSKPSVTASGVEHRVAEVKDLKTTTKGGELECESVQVCTKSFCEGYNAFLLVMDSDKVAADPFQSPSWAAVRDTVKAVFASKAQSQHLRVSFSVLNAAGNSADLLNKPDSAAAIAWEPMVIASSPLFGPVIHTSALHEVASEEAFGQLKEQAAANLRSSSLWGEDTAVYVSMVNSFASHGDCLVSCYSASFAGLNSNVFDGAMGRNPKLREVYRYGFGGTSVTTAVLSITKDDDVQWVNRALATLSSAAECAKRPVRRGSIATFIEFTSTSIQKRQDMMKNTDDPKQVAENEKVVRPMVLMMKDYQEVMDNPDNHLPQAYAPDGVLTSGSPRANGAAAEQPQEQSQEKPQEKPQNQSQEKPGEVQARALPQPESRTASAVPAGSSEGGTQESLVDTSDKIIVAFVPREVAPGGEQKLHIQGSDYAVFEVVNSGAAEGSKALKALLQQYIRGCNCAIVCMSSFAGNGGVTSEPAIAAFMEGVRQAAMSEASSGRAFAFDLNLYVAAKTTVVADLLSSSPPPAQRAALEVGRSPVWGMRASNVTNKRYSSVEKITETLSNGFARLTPELMREVVSGEAVLMAHAIERREARFSRDSKKDVEIFSLCVQLTGPQSDAFQKVPPEEACALHELTNAVVGSSFTTIGVANLNPEGTAEAAKALGTVTRFVQGKRTAVERTQSVQIYMGAAVAKIEKIRHHAKDMPQEEIDHAHRLEAAVRAHQTIIANFDAPLPQVTGDNSSASQTSASRSQGQQDRAARSRAPPAGATPTPSRKTPTAASTSETEQPTSIASPWQPPEPNSVPNMAATIAVVSGISSLGGAVEIKADGNASVNVFHGGNKEPASYPFGLVIDHSSTDTSAAVAVLESEPMTHLITRVSTGHNGSLFVTTRPDDENNLESEHTSKELVPLVVARAVKAVADEREIFTSTVLMRGNKARAAGHDSTGGYEPISLAVSPLFGPTPTCSPLQPVVDHHELTQHFYEAYSQAVQEHAAVVMVVVFKHIMEKDVCVNSLLIMCDPTGGRQMASVIRHSHNTSRDLYSYALGGSSATVGVLNLHAMQDEDKLLIPVLEAFKGMASVKNSHLRTGSVKMFANYAKQSLKRTEAQVNETTDENARAKATSRLERHRQYYQDAVAMIEAPANLVPPTYVQE